MSFAETKWGGFAKIIVDTSTMTVGDTVRVKSITTGTNYDKQVVTVGTPLIWETDIYKDYVKICMVQTINDTPTEIGGVYKTVDYGQTLFIDVIDKTTLGGIQGILNAHQESSQLAIGDEVDITVNGSPWTMQIAGINLYDSHEVIFASKYIYETCKWGIYQGNLPYSSSEVYNECASFYNDISQNEKIYIKDFSQTSGQSGTSYSTFTAKCWLMGTYEAGFNYATTTQSAVPQYHFPLFTTQANRIRTYNGGSVDWWLRDGNGNGYDINYYLIKSNGDIGWDTPTSANRGLLPCFHLTADS